MTAEIDRPLSLAARLGLLATLLPASALRVTTAEQAPILDLARIAAHASERIAAPISTFLVGVAFASLEPRERANRLREVAARLENASDS